MKKLLAFLGLTIIAMLTACSNDNLDAIVEAGDNAMGVGKDSEVPVLLSIGAGAQTRSPLESSGSNFATPTGASPEDYKYMGIFALAQTNTPAGGQSGPVATENIKWDGSVSYARLLWNHPTMTTITDQWNGAPVASYTAMTLMDPTTLATSPTAGSYKYPSNSWYNYYFYAYYPRVEDISEENNVVTANYSLDGSQDIITGYAMPPAAQADNGYCGNYFSDIKRAEGSLPFNKQPQLQLTHHLAQLRFFVCSEADPVGTFQVKGITLLSVPRDWALTVADKANPTNTGTLTSTSTTTTSMPILTMAVDGSNNMTSASDEAVFDGTTYKNLTTTPVIAGYAMVPTTQMISDANNDLNREFSTSYQVQLTIKSGDTESTQTRTITTPTGGFQPGKVYNVIIRAVQETSSTPLSSVTTAHLGRVIGDDGYIYSTVSAANAAGAIASGIIAYVGSAGSVDESSDTYKGLAIALTDANGGSSCQWYTENSGYCVSRNETLVKALAYKDGIACTETLVNSNGSGVTTNCSDHTHAAATAASNYSTARPSGASAWFLPSIGQWNLIVQGLASAKSGSTVSTNLTLLVNSTYYATNLNTVITDAGGTGFLSDSYWSSTEYNNTICAWYVHFDSGCASYRNKNVNQYVRAVFAF